MLSARPFIRSRFPEGPPLGCDDSLPKDVLPDCLRLLASPHGRKTNSLPLYPTQFCKFAASHTALTISFLFGMLHFIRVFPLPRFAAHLGCPSISLLWFLIFNLLIIPFVNCLLSMAPPFIHCSCNSQHGITPYTDSQATVLLNESFLAS